LFKEYGALSTMLYEHTKPISYSIDGDIEYYSKKLKNLSGRILEAGVGTGRLLVPLIQSGLTVDGVDLSNEMLEQCKKNMDEHGVSGNLYNQDLTKLSLPYKYDAIIIPTGSFCLLPKLKIKEILNGFNNHLNNNGKVILDLEMPFDFKEGDSSSSKFSLSEDTGIILTTFNEKIDWFEQKVSSISKYELIKNGAVIETEYSNFTLYWYGISEFEILLNQSGFKNIQYEIGYGKNLSQIITFIAEKNDE